MMLRGVKVFSVECATGLLWLSCPLGCRLPVYGLLKESSFDTAITADLCGWAPLYK